MIWSFEMSSINVLNKIPFKQNEKFYTCILCTCIHNEYKIRRNVYILITSH